MTPWLLITVLLAIVNLAAFLVVRGRWGRIVGLLGLASLLGTIVGDAVGGATGVDVLVLGDYHVLAACIGAQLLMLGTLLLVAMLPTADERADSNSADQ
jgi:hypothetical protein